MKKIMVFVLISIAIVGCNNNQHQKYIGKYEHPSQSDGSPSILEIFKDGDIFLIKDGNHKPIPAEAVKEGLKVSRTLFSLTQDNKTLYFAGKEAKRLSEEEAKALLAKREADKELCAKLDKEAELKNRELKNDDEWNRYVEELLQRKPKYCRLENDNMRIGY